jgi:hypothetical protein
MRRLLLAFGLVLAVSLIAAPAVIAADPSMGHTGRIVVSTQGDATIPVGDHADVVFVTRGVATIAGEVNTLVVIDGSAVLSGATVETILAVRSPVDLSGGTQVLGDVMTVDSTVTTDASVVVGGAVRDLAQDLAGLWWVIAPMAFLFFIGFSVAAVVGGLLLAGLASRQVRSAERLMVQEPFTTIGVGIVGVIAPILLAVLLSVTIVGVPLALALIFGLWPLAAIVGFLVAGIAIGEWVLRRTSPDVQRDRPYLAAVVGMLLLEVMSIIPFVGAIASLFGFGAVLLLCWRVLRGDRPATTTHVVTPTAAPLAS